MCQDPALVELSLVMKTGIRPTNIHVSKYKPLGALKEKNEASRASLSFLIVHTVGAHMYLPNECKTVLWPSSERRETLGSCRKGVRRRQGRQVEEQRGWHAIINGSLFPAWATRLGAECWVLGGAPLGRRRGPCLLSQECALPLPPPQVGQAPLGLPF